MMKTDTYVSIVPGVDNSSRNLEYYDASFTKTKSEAVTVNSKNNDSMVLYFTKDR